MSFAGRIHAAAMAAEQPVGAVLELTYRCNWRCSFCYNPRHSDVAPLSTAEWIGVVSSLRRAGALSVTLTGGEPLAHPGAVAIVREATRIGMMVTLFTNGSLVDEETARAIADAGVFLVEISIHGAKATTHEALTATRGSFDAAIEAVRRLRALDVRVMLKSVLTRLNEDEIDAMRALADELGVPFSLDPAIIPTDTGDLTPLGLVASDAARKRELRRAFELRQLARRERRSGEANCALARTSLRIDPEGNLFPCPRWTTPLGNVRTSSLADMWKAPERLALTAVADEANERLLADTPAVAAFPFCPAIAATSGGDPFRPSPAQRHLANLADDAWSEATGQ